ncbi:hypothetical protein [Streptomyces sp. ATCC 21386]|uniref:hypothetical protein n=1 Tax=Streptomyces sp. ATCC 21386 TaxID=2699428 RepID=UPI001BFF4066|nr:hypothetical protein [Streptomyces sp. ATCC 21386]
MADRGLLRASRVAVFSLVCVLLAATGHGMAAGHHPPLALLAVGGTVVGVTAGRLAGRERSLVQIGGAVTVTQGALHVLFALAGPTRTSTAPAAHHGGHAGHSPHAEHHTTVSATGATGTGVEPVGMALDAAHPSPFMLLAHLVAGLGAAWWLRQGEAVVWRLCRLLGAPVSATLRALDLLRRWARHQAVLSRHRVARQWGAGEHEVPFGTRVLEHTLARRGPPLLFTR